MNLEDIYKDDVFDLIDVMIDPVDRVPLYRIPSDLPSDLIIMPPEATDPIPIYQHDEIEILPYEPAPALHQVDIVEDLLPVPILPPLPSIIPIDQPGSQAVSTAQTYSGVILNSATEQPIPFASIYLFKNGIRIAGDSADGRGNFSITTDTSADTITVSAAEYNSWSFPASTYQHKFELEPKDKTLPGFFTYGTKKKDDNTWMLLLLLALVMSNKKKSVGKVDTGTVLAIAAGVVMIIGVKTLTTILEKLGLFKKKETKELDAQAENPDSPWDPNFWKTGGPGTILLHMQDAQNASILLHDFVFSLIDDDEEAVITLFRQLKTQSQVSFLADVFSQMYGQDLFAWLRGGAWWQPWADHLSEGELNQINRMVLNMPKYKL